MKTHVTEENARVVQAIFASGICDRLRHDGASEWIGLGRASGWPPDIVEITVERSYAHPGFIFLKGRNTDRLTMLVEHVPIEGPMRGPPSKILKVQIQRHHGYRGTDHMMVLTRNAAGHVISAECL